MPLYANVVSMSLYKKTSGNPKLENSFFLFLDVLGFSAEIIYNHKTGDSQSNLTKFNQAFNMASPHLTKGPKTWDYKIFTDNIALATPINKFGDDENDFGFIIVSLIEYQLEMVLADFFIRGAWSVGQFYMDNLIVYGYPLIEAYRLESQKAINPRIIFSEDMKSTIKRYLSYYAKGFSAPLRAHLLKDIDGELFVNYLFAIYRDNENPDYSALLKHKNVIEARLNKHKANPKVFPKYVWSAEYHNFFCQKFITKCPVQYFIHGLGSSRNFSFI